MTFMEMVLYWIRSSKNQPLSSNIILKTTTLFLYSFYFILMQLFLIMLFLYFLSVALILPDTFRILFRSLMFSGVTVCTFLFVPFCCCMLCVFPVIHRHPGSMRHHLPVTLIEHRNRSTESICPNFCFFFFSFLSTNLFCCLVLFPLLMMFH